MKPDVIRPGYDEAGLLRHVDVWLQQATAPTLLLDPATASRHAVTSISYNARGQRVSIGYGNGTGTAYGYDPQTFRLVTLTTTRPGSSAAAQQTVQDLSYFYDPVGNRHGHPRRRRHAGRYLLRQPAGRAVRQLHLRRGVPADRRDWPRAPWPDKRQPAATEPGHERRLVPHGPAAARRRHRDGHLHRELRLRRGREPAVDGPRGELGQLDPPVRVQRAVADHRHRDRQPSDGHQRARRPGRRARSPRRTRTTRTAT